MDDRKVGLFLWAFLAGLAVMSQVAVNFGTIPYVTNILQECEELLPRSQTCVLIAVPKQETIQEK